MSDSATRREYMRYAGATAASVAVGSIAGCLGDDDDEPADADDTQDDTDDEPATDGDFVDDEFTLVNVGFVTPYDPAADAGWVGRVLQDNMYDSLVEMDPETLEPTEHIATSWDIEDDGMTWVFEIRDDVPLHHGDTLDAEDVAYSMERVMALQRGTHGLFEGFVDPDDIEVRDDTTIAFNMEQPYGLMVASMVEFLIVDADTVQENEVDGDWGQEYLQEETAGSGPYMISEAREEEVMFEAFEDYWEGWEGSNFERARYEYVEETSTIQNMMELGEADMVSSWLGPEDYDYFRDLDGVTVHEEPSWRTLHVEMNTQKAPLDDPKVREALVFATDYQNILDGVYGGADQLIGPIPSTMRGFNEELEPYEHDIDRAEQALAEADYTVEEINEIGIELVYNVVLPYTRSSALALQENFQDLGIEVEIEGEPFPTLSERNQDPETSPHMQWLFHTARTPSPDSLLHQMFHEDSLASGVTGTWFTTDEISNTLNEARVTIDEQERIEMYHEVQRLIHEGYPTIPIAEYPSWNPMQDNIEGFTYRGVDGKEVRFHDYHLVD